MIAAAFRITGVGAFFGAGLVLGCLAVAAVLPLPAVPQVKEKLEWFRAHRGEYTALFLGTSRVRRHIIPPLFDRLAAEHGVEMRSFNLGVDSLVSPEDGYVLDLALRAAPPRLRYVFIELSYFSADFAGEGAKTIRAPYWHDLERTVAVWRQLFAEDLQRIKPLKKKGRWRWNRWLPEMREWAGLMTEHGRLFVLRGTNLGRGAAMWRIACGIGRVNDSLAPLGPGRDGFIPSDEVLNGANLAEYDRLIGALKSGPSRVRTLDRVPQENLETMLAKVRARGAEPILVIAPSSGGYVLKPRRAIAPILDFSDPHQWPALFDPRYRADITHLNTAGAEVFTRALATRFLSLAAPSVEQR